VAGVEQPRKVEQTTVAKLAKEARSLLADRGAG